MTTKLDENQWQTFNKKEKNQWQTRKSFGHYVGWELVSASYLARHDND